MGRAVFTSQKCNVEKVTNAFMNFFPFFWNSGSVLQLYSESSNDKDIF